MKILPPEHDHVIIQIVHKEEWLFTNESIINVSVTERQKEQERSKKGMSSSVQCAQLRKGRLVSLCLG